MSKDDCAVSEAVGIKKSTRPRRQMVVVRIRRMCCSDLAAREISAVDVEHSAR